MSNLFIGRAGQAGPGVPASVQLDPPFATVKSVGSATAYLGSSDSVTVDGGGSYPLVTGESVTIPVTETCELWVIGPGASVAIIRQEPEA